MTKIHYVKDFQTIHDKTLSTVLCNSNGVPNLSLSKRYELTRDINKVTCFKCLHKLKLLELIK